MKRTTRPAKQTRFVVVSREGVEVIRDTDAGEYQAFVYGVEIGAGYPTQLAAEQAADAAMYALLNERKAAA